MRKIPVTTEYWEALESIHGIVGKYMTLSEFKSLWRADLYRHTGQRSPRALGSTFGAAMRTSATVMASSTRSFYFCVPTFTPLIHDGRRCFLIFLSQDSHAL